MVSDSTRFGNFRLLSRLGRGGMAETWKAELVGAAGVTRSVVIKRVLPGFACIPSFVEMFVNEARITATLSHGNIAQVLDFGQVDGEYFLAIEYVHGRTLAALLERAREQGQWHLPVPLACLIGIEVCKGLHYAHHRTDTHGAPLSIVHRDVSPDNVMVSFEGQVKLVDFGIAHSNLEGRTQTEPGLVKGKYRYFSPEQARGERLDARSDVFATGVMLYELLCGQLPFAGNEHVSVHALLRGDHPPPAALNPALADGLGDIIDQAMELDASHRTKSAAALQEQLSSYLFKRSPAFDARVLQSFLHQVFADDLKAESIEPQRDPQHLHDLELWRPTAVRPKATAMRVARAAAAPAPAERHRRSIVPFLAGTTLLLAAGATGAFALREQSPGVAPSRVLEGGHRAVDRVKFTGDPILLDLDRNSVQYGVFSVGGYVTPPNSPFGVTIKASEAWPPAYGWVDFAASYQGRKGMAILLTAPAHAALVYSVGAFELRPFSKPDPRERSGRMVHAELDGVPGPMRLSPGLVDEQSGGYVVVTDMPQSRDVTFRLDFVSGQAAPIDVAIACRYSNMPESRHLLAPGEAVDVCSPLECALAALGPGKAEGKLDVWVKVVDASKEPTHLLTGQQPDPQWLDLLPYAQEQLAAKRPEEALLALELVQGEPAELHLLAADAYEQLGDTRSAKWHLQRLLAHSPAEPFAAQAKKRLAAL